LRTRARRIGETLLILAFWAAFFALCAVVKGWPVLIVFGVFSWYVIYYHDSGPYSGTRAQQYEARKRIRLTGGIGVPGELARWRKENPGRLTPRDEQLRDIAARRAT
jgi:hypothetical protein